MEMEKKHLRDKSAKGELSLPLLWSLKGLILEGSGHLRAGTLLPAERSSRIPHLAFPSVVGCFDNQAFPLFG